MSLPPFNTEDEVNVPEGIVTDDTDGEFGLEPQSFHTLSEDEIEIPTNEWKPVGVNDLNLFPPRVEQRLARDFVGSAEVPGSIEDIAIAKVGEQVTLQIAPLVSDAEAAQLAAEMARDETIVTVSPLADWTGTVTPAIADIQRKYLHRKLTGDVTLELPVAPSSVAWSVTLYTYQDEVGGRTLTIVDASTENSTPIVLSIAADAEDLVRIEWTGYKYLALLIAKDIGIPSEWESE